MPTPATLLDLYLHLAQASDEQHRPLQRDKFLVLAAGLALQSGVPRLADECRRRIVQETPNHLLGSHGSAKEAFAAEDVRHYANQLLRVYPFEKAEYLLHKFHAAGYSGQHGFEKLIDALDAAGPRLPVLPPAATAPKPSATRPKTVAKPNVDEQGSRPAPREVPAPPARPMASASRSEPALRAPAKSMPTAGSNGADLEPIPMELAAAAVTPRVPVGFCVCLILFAFALGLTLGGIAVTFLMP